MGRITPSARQLYQETVDELRRLYRGALIDRSHRDAFDFLLRDAWEAEQAAMANANIPVIIDRLNLTANVHNRKMLEKLMRELQQREDAINELRLELRALKEKVMKMTGGTKEDTKGGNKEEAGGQQQQQQQDAVATGGCTAET